MVKEICFKWISMFFWKIFWYFINSNSVTQIQFSQEAVPACNYMFKVNNRNASTRCGICSKLTIKTPERCHWRWFYYWLIFLNLHGNQKKSTAKSYIRIHKVLYIHPYQIQAIWKSTTHVTNIYIQHLNSVFIHRIFQVFLLTLTKKLVQKNVICHFIKNNFWSSKF